MWFVVVAMSGCVGLTENKPLDSSTSAVGTDGPPPTEVSVQGLLFGVGAGDFEVTRPAGADALVAELFTYDVLIYVEEELSDSLHLDLSLAGEDGYQNPCEPVVALPKADWDNPVFRSGPADFGTTLGGEPVTLYGFELQGTFDPYAFGWADGHLLATFDAREIAPALPEELDACEIVAGLGSPCTPCADGAASCIPLELSGIEASLVSWPFDPTPDGAGC